MGEKLLFSRSMWSGGCLCDWVAAWRKRLSDPQISSTRWNAVSRTILTSYLIARFVVLWNFNFLISFELTMLRRTPFKWYYVRVLNTSPCYEHMFMAWYCGTSSSFLPRSPISLLPHLWKFDLWSGCASTMRSGFSPSHRKVGTPIRLFSPQELHVPVGLLLLPRSLKKRRRLSPQRSLTPIALHLLNHLQHKTTHLHQR